MTETPEQHRQRGRSYYERNRERRIEAARKWREKHEKVQQVIRVQIKGWGCRV